MEMIRVADMLNTMDTWIGPGERMQFSIEWVTCNMKQNTGGKKLTLESAVLVGSVNSNSDKKNPDHYGNYTRNIRSVNGDRLIKIHPLLVTRFNGMRVIL